MSAAVIDVLLAIGVAVELACCVGVLVMGDAYDKLHYLGPATIVGPRLHRGRHRRCSESLSTRPA